jgi:hypothetical protein
MILRERLIGAAKGSRQQLRFGFALSLVLATGIAAVLIFFRVADSSRRVAASDFLGQMQDASSGGGSDHWGAVASARGFAAVA